jgi:hypothetical protein
MQPAASGLRRRSTAAAAFAGLPPLMRALRGGPIAGGAAEALWRRPVPRRPSS